MNPSKVLIVKYLPSMQHSKTKRLLDVFIEHLKGETNIEHLDLLKNPPDYITSEILEAYVARNYEGQKISDSQKKLLGKFDRMTKQFKAADVFVLAYPMYNYSMPGLVKVYFDSIMLKGETFDTAESGFVGLMGGKKALVLSTSGGDFTGKYAKYDLSLPLARLLLGFMGFSDIKIISAQGVDLSADKAEEAIANAQKEVKKIISKWNL